MSDMQEFSAFSAGESTAQEQFSPKGAMSIDSEENKSEMRVETHNLKKLEESLDGQSYFLGEVPQSFLCDPQAFVPLNSDQLIGSSNVIEQILSEVGLMIQEEVGQIQKFQKKINFWEDRIEKNKALIQKNLVEVKQNNTDVIFDKKNRDYWFGRGEAVEIDYSHAEVSNRPADWAWLIKKYGLKNADGTAIHFQNSSVDELCNGESTNLAAEYRATGNKYETARKNKEAENKRMIHENAKHQNANEMLQTYIAASYTNDIEPLQDGVLLLKEFGVKLKGMSQEGSKATYGEMRSWAESFLDDFLKSNPKVTFAIVTEFRRLASIPLPADHC
ncbi:MAG: hypothetical protein V4487_07075 [Chlamydiota bacterium]